MGTWNYLWHFIFSFFLWSLLPVAATGSAATHPSTSHPSTAMSHSSSSPAGSSAATPSPQQSSTSSTTEAGSAATSRPSTALVASAPSSTPGITSVGSGAVMAEAMTHSQAPSAPSPKPSASASGTSPASDASKASLSSTPAGSVETQATRLTSRPLTQGQATAEAGTASSSTGSPLPAAATAPAATRATTPPGEGERPTMNQGSGTTTEPNAKTSLALPATSLATPSTTHNRTSTSLNPSFTVTCSPITLSIQLENVTSTMIRFSWKPQGGTGDSPYRVHLWGGSCEMKRRLNTTSTAFENLLSDHEYQISVDVSTCSENVSTSLTVRTAAEVFSGTTRITNEVFMPEYQNKSSTAFKDFETKFIEEIKKHLPQKSLELIKEKKMRIVINSIKNGSVIVVFNIVLDVGENITELEISDAFTQALNMSTVLKADLKKTVIEARNSCQPGLNDCSQHATCTAEGASYSCQCNKGFTDNSPQVPGRVCQQKQNIPSQQMTTVPPKSATGRFTGSTTNSSFTTTFASGPCMPVSIKVQNVTGETIQFSWTSGRRGSLYTVSLVDGNWEINKTTTKETKSMFKHLLPGHVYTISVAVLSCAENIWTSVSVRTDPVSCFNRTEFCLPQNTGCPDLKYIVCSHYQAFACSALLKSQTFNHTLYNSNSEGYKMMSESIKTEVVREMRIKLKDDHFDTIMLGFRPGSVIAYFISLLQKQEPIDVNVMQAYLSRILKSKFGDQTEVTVQSLSAQSSIGKSSTWKVAVIVLGVLLGVALVLILLVTLSYIYMKKRAGKYLVEPKGLLGNFVYKHL